MLYIKPKSYFTNSCFTNSCFKNPYFTNPYITNLFFPKIKLDKTYELASLKPKNINNLIYDNFNSDRYSKLKVLILDSNNLTDEDIELIAKNKKRHMNKLKILDLSHNLIEDTGAFALANNINKIDYLNISDNRIGLSGYMSLFEKYISHDIIDLKIDNNVYHTYMIDDIDDTNNFPAFDIITDNEKCEWILV
jgi:hypothetical protein